MFGRQGAGAGGRGEGGVIVLAREGCCVFLSFNAYVVVAVVVMFAER